MTVRNERIGPFTPMGATLAEGGATFRTWAPAARDVYLVTDAATTADWSTWTPVAGQRLVPLGDGTWAGYSPGVVDGDPYLFWVVGPAGGRDGFKRDPWARELGTRPAYPDCPCIVRRASPYPWHDDGWTPPAFRDLIIYQLHVGVFWGADPTVPRPGTFLDVVARLPYLQALGVNAVLLLPVQEYDGDFGLGYAGLDYFSPEMAYQVEDPTELARHLDVVNRALVGRGGSPISAADLAPGPNQLMCLVDLCHLHGIGVLFDLVYNHAGGSFGDRSMAFYDRRLDDGTPWASNKDTLYFGNGEHAGGLIFDYERDQVRDLLINNARFFLDEYHIDGIRYDQVGVATGAAHGERFVRDLTSTIRHHRPAAIQIAEYWEMWRARAVTPVTASPQDLGFDAALSDRLRLAVREVLRRASAGADAHLPLDVVRDAIYPPPAFPAPWQAVHSLEDHDIIRWKFDQGRPDSPRVPTLADPSDPGSRYARARSRVAMAVLLTAPGIPMLFMGQEILEPKPWHDDLRFWAQFLISWDRVSTDDSARDFLRCTRDLVGLRRRLPALTGDGVRVPQVHERDRVLVVHRWVEHEGRDVVVVASLNEHVLDGYQVDMPWPGRWNEVFNSDAYDPFPNPDAVGNGGAVSAGDQPGVTYPYTSRIRIPAMGALILTR